MGLHFLDDAEVDRLKAMLSAFESGRLNFSAPQQAKFNGAPVETRIGIVTEDISPFADGVAGSGTVTYYKLNEDGSLSAALPKNETVYNLSTCGIPLGLPIHVVRDPFSGSGFALKPECPGSCDPTGLDLLVTIIGSGASPCHALDGMYFLPYTGLVGDEPKWGPAGFPMHCDGSSGSGTGDDDQTLILYANLDTGNAFLGIGVQDGDVDPTLSGLQGTLEIAYTCPPFIASFNLGSIPVTNSCCGFGTTFKASYTTVDSSVDGTTIYGGNSDF